MSTRGDLFVVSKSERGMKQTNRYKIWADAYLDGAGMKKRISEAVALRDKVLDDRGIDMGIDSALLSLYPEWISIDNLNREGGYIYILNLIENTITYGYADYGLDELDSWIKVSSIKEFIGSKEEESELAGILKGSYQLARWTQEIEKISVLTLNTVTQEALFEALISAKGITLLKDKNETNSLHCEIVTDAKNIEKYLIRKGYSWRNDLSSPDRLLLAKEGY